MANWLDRMVKSPPAPRRPLPPSVYSLQETVPPGHLPRAALVYGIAASALFVVGLFLALGKGDWWSGLLVLAVAGILCAYAVYFVKFAVRRP